MNAEVENTKRRLANEPLLATSLWCRFGIHQWTTWSDPQKERLETYHKQHKHCAQCHIVKMRFVKPHD